MSQDSLRGDYFDRARKVAVGALLAASIAAITGSFLDWVTITERPRVRPGADFRGQRIEEPRFSRPYTGVDARDGWIVVAGAGVLIVAATGLAARRRTGWLAFTAAVVIGSIAFAAYRSVGDISSSISDRMEIVGDPEPAIGVMLVAAAGVAALLGSVLGIIASPRR
jgi:LPXTG-motif cell wall-anchored protein